MSTAIDLEPGPQPGRTLPVAAPTPPPFRLVAAHFTAAFLWALAGSAGLVWLAPTLATGSFLDPRVLALTHTFTLGFLTTVIMGVLYQIYPAMLGAAFRSVRVAWWSLILQTVGTALLVTGLFLSRHQLLGLGWITLFAATFGLAWNVLPGRRRAVRNKQVGAYVSYAHTAFGFAMAIGLARIGDSFGWWTTPRLALLASHFQFAGVGFVGLTAMGVGSRMLPMFLGAPFREAAELRWIPRLILTGTIIFGLGALFSNSAAEWAGAILMATGAILFLKLALGWYDPRGRREYDGAIQFMLASLASLAAAIPLGLAALQAGLTQPALQVAYPVLVILGWLGGLIYGVSYRILPNLTWHSRYASKVRNQNVPGLAELLSPRVGLAAAWLHSLGILLLIPGLVFNSGGAARAGAVLLFGAIAGTLWHHGRMALRS